MKAVVQRVTQASVMVEEQQVGAIDTGYLVLLGIGHDDTEKSAQQMALKVSKLRIFRDEAGKMNLSLADVGGKALAVSQFTLMGDTRKGNRPSFIDAARPEQAEPLYECFCSELAALGIPVERGIFGAKMLVSISNDGPVTILMET